MTWEDPESRGARFEIAFCPRCGQRNRLKRQSKSVRYRCGNCKTELASPFGARPAMPPFAPTSWRHLWSGLPLRTRVIVISLGAALAGFGLWLGTRPARKWADPVDPQILSLTGPNQASLVEQASLSPSRSLPNGTRIQLPESVGNGILRIDNGMARDAVVKLIDERLRKTILSVYVQAGQSVSVPDLPEGLFRAVFATGEDWDSQKGSFRREEVFGRFEGEVDLYVKHRAEPHREYGDYATCSLKIPGVLGENAAISRIWEEQFQAY